MDEHAEERYAVEMLTLMQEEYVKACKPYIDMLVRIRELRRPHMVVTYAQAQELGLIPEEDHQNA